MKIRLIKSQIHTKDPSHVRSLKCSQCKNVRQFLKLSVRASAREREWGRSGLERKKWEDGRVRQGHGDSKRSSMWRCGRVVEKNRCRGREGEQVDDCGRCSRENKGGWRGTEVTGGRKAWSGRSGTVSLPRWRGGTGMKKEKKKNWEEKEGRVARGNSEW